MWKQKSIYILTAATIAVSATRSNAWAQTAAENAPENAPAAAVDATPEKVPSAAAVVAAQQSGVPISSNTIADIAQAVAPAVVNIDVKEEVAQRVMTMPDFESLFGNVPFQFFYNGQQVNPNEKQAPNTIPRMPKVERKDTGSGFIIRSDGYILTNAHVVRHASKIKVTLNDKRVLDGTVVGTDGFSDLAVVKVDAKDLPVANMGSSDKVRPGEFVIAIGSPLELDHTVTFGIISAVGRSAPGVNRNISFIQTDAAINPGNSGGPLLDLNGKVIGINTWIRRDAQNIGFSIPIDIAKMVSSELIEHKFVQRPWLGIAMGAIDETFAKSLGLPTNTIGVYVSEIIRNSPAAKSELQRGDIIQKIDGKNVTESKEVQDIVRSHKVSDILHFLVLRDKALKAVAVNIGQYPTTTSPEKSSEPEDD